MDPQGKIIGLFCNYSKISFNFGPTLLYWLAIHEPQVYEAILAADKQSIENFSGHGSAIAQAYNHMIMPLANRRDKETQIIWGIKDFEARFGRFPEGMWLPETAVDIETLEILSTQGIKFTILAPHQARRVRKIGIREWTDVSGARIDTRRAYLCKLPSGRTINLFFYDRTIASDASFGTALSNGEIFANKILSSLKDVSDRAAIASLATDGELYGHHRSHGDMTLAYCLYYIEKNKLARITNYSEFLEKYPPQFEVEIQENTSWSCGHGIERWRSDCGDNTGRNGWNQAWRKPLREAMDWLRDTLATCFEYEAKHYLKDPWTARNKYIKVVLDRSRENVEKFLSEQITHSLSEEEKSKVIKLLEMQRQSMLMYTSCGWFFDEISGIETIQVMMYAARAMQLAHAICNVDLEEQYVKMLEQAPSNIPEFHNGANIYNIFVKPAMMDPTKLSAQSIISSLFIPNPTPPIIITHGCCFRTTIDKYKLHVSGKFRLVFARVKVSSGVTLDEDTFEGAAIWLGDHNVSCGVTKDMPPESYSIIEKEILERFDKGQISEVVQLIPKHFGEHNYSLKDLFKDDQRRILDFVIEDGVKEANDLYGIIYYNNTALLRFMKDIRVPAPKSFRIAAEMVLNNQITQLLATDDLDIEGLQKVINDMQRLSIEIDSAQLSLKASERIAKEFDIFEQNPENIQIIERISRLVKAVTALPIKLDLWYSQNIAFNIVQNQYNNIKERADEAAQAWVLAFIQLCELIGIKLE
jgi:alpha-amylase/alpha-mannosidase (GH57 family)